MQRRLLHAGGFLQHQADLVHGLQLLINRYHFANQAGGGGHPFGGAGRLDYGLGGICVRELRSGTPQFADAAFQAARAALAIRADELGHLIDRVAHRVAQLQLALRAVFLRHQVLQLGFAGSGDLLVENADLCLERADAGVHIALQFGNILLRGCFAGARAGRSGGNEGRFGLGRLEGQLCGLRCHALRVELVHGIAGQAHCLDARQGMPVPVNHRVQMVEDGVATQICYCLRRATDRPCACRGEQRDHRYQQQPLTPPIGFAECLSFFCRIHIPQYRPFRLSDTAQDASSVARRVAWPAFC